MTGRKTTIHTDDEADRWRWVCLCGHRSWEPPNHHFWCAKCARTWIHDDDRNPELHELRDKRTGETKRRGESRLVTPPTLRARGGVGVNRATTIRPERTDEGAGLATRRNVDLVGRGATAARAAARYCELVAATSDGAERDGLADDASSP